MLIINVPMSEIFNTDLECRSSLTRIISLLLFFIVFVTMIVFVFKLPKSSIEEVSQLPLDNNINSKETTHE